MMLRRLSETVWLDETEQVESQSLNQMVLNEVHRRLGARRKHTDGTIRIVEIGCGLGANRRRLSARMAAPQHWRMIDFDPEIIAAFRKRFRTDNDPSTDLVLLDDNSYAVANSLLDGADLLILSGRSTVLPVAALQQFLTAAKAMEIAVWAVLQPTGYVKFEPVSPDDQKVHQMTVPAGPDPASHLVRLLEETGYRVLKGESDWVVRGENDSFWHSKGRALQRHFLQRYLGQARRNHPDQAAGLLAWANKRSVLIERKKTVLTVGHTDIFAIPEQRE
ncbi:MAG: class I SAM-dependent methyltransferase [Alphaproteobacteria bacterium]